VRQQAAQHKKSLEHLYRAAMQVTTITAQTASTAIASSKSKCADPLGDTRAALQNTEQTTSTLCIEPLYKLHSTRAKIALEPAYMRDDGMLEVLERYSLARCVERACGEVVDAKLWDKCNIDVSKDVSSRDVSFLARAEIEQREFEAAVKMPVGRAEGGEAEVGGAEAAAEARGEATARGGGGGSWWGVMRDCMLGMRITIAKNQRFSSSKMRFRLAWMMQQCGQPEHELLNGERAEVASALSAEVGELLLPLFFKPEDEGNMNLLTTHNVQNQFTNYYKDSEESQVASFSNLNSFMRNQIKLIRLLAEHLRRHSRALDLLDKLTEIVITMEKRLPRESASGSLDPAPQSLQPAVSYTVHMLFSELQEVVLRGISLQNGEAEHGAADSSTVELAFRITGKLRGLLQDHMDVFNYLNVSVKPKLLVEAEAGVMPVLKPAGTPVTQGDEIKRITLSDKWCPLLSLLYQACRLYCKQAAKPYHETTGGGNGNGCMACAMTVWKTTFRADKKLKLPAQPASERSSTQTQGSNAAPAVRHVALPEMEERRKQTLSGERAAVPSPLASRSQAPSAPAPATAPAPSAVFPASAPASAPAPAPAFAAAPLPASEPPRVARDAAVACEPDHPDDVIILEPDSSS